MTVLLTRVLAAVGALMALLFGLIVMNFGMLWLRAFLSGARVPLIQIIGMRLRKVSPPA